MTHCQLTAKTSFPFDAFTVSRRKAERKKAARKRIIKRTAHFLCFLLYWAVVFAVAELAILVVMITFISLT